MYVKLKVLRGASTGKEVAIQAPKFLIGRSEECNLRANSDAISRRHCAIVTDSSGVSIRDLGSRNGTYVNGSRIDGPHRIQVGDQLRVGPLEFLVTFAKSKTAKASKPASTSDSTIRSDEDMAELVSDWLEEVEASDDPTVVTDRETRHYQASPGETVAMEVPSPTQSSSDTQKNARAKGDGDTKKVPRRGARNSTPKDTQEAAAQMLRKFFNRG